MTDPDLEHLHDHVQLHLAAIESRARLATEDSPETIAVILQRISEVRDRIAARERDATLIAPAAMTRLGLTATERDVVWLLAAVATDGDARALLPRATGDTTIDPTLAAIKLLVHGSTPSLRAFAELSDNRTLRRLEIIERSDAGGAELHESRWTWALSRRMLALLHGDAELDPALGRIVRLPNAPVAIGDLVVAPDALIAARRAIHAERGVVLVSGLRWLGRRTLLAAVAHEAGVNVLEVDARRLSHEPGPLAKQLRCIARECTLHARIPMITNLDALVGETAIRLDLVGSELVAQLGGLVLATCGTNRPRLEWDRPTIEIELGTPPSHRLGALWLAQLGQGSPSDAELLATQYALAPALIHHAAAAAKARAAGGTVEPADVYAGIRAVLDDRIGRYAKRITATQTWDDLVLPADQLDSIAELIARVRGRRRVYEQWGFAAKLGKGLGVSALFSGRPGTGKTMVAALIARDLGLELYQVDLSRVVSKWIGETEKNLAAVFDAAEAGHAIILFDEADALFGKRTDVKSSNDRHANLETNFLLQRLESFTGICLLTSNHESNLDPAFHRRLSLHLRFDVPDLGERERLWRAMLPAAAPVAVDVDFEDLARSFVMTGGHIRNAALRAAFLAADDEGAIAAGHLARAAQLEYEALGKLAG